MLQRNQTNTPMYKNKGFKFLHRFRGYFEGTIVHRGDTDDPSIKIRLSTKIDHRIPRQNAPDVHYQHRIGEEIFVNLGNCIEFSAISN